MSSVPLEKVPEKPFSHVLILNGYEEGDRHRSALSSIAISTDTGRDTGSSVPAGASLWLISV
ncbi:hypothetical protein N7509_013846 [Penicillium cosmopolitanum]|uniref:Uncharacterized protein n=1 Tax=Penicillium cosmopolitanum TaxID=1131564 RepID=A0A9W9VEW6_9EURO|nr:uncharacterized protein N7509_013846 [Penicillium cosmopolitanum]KAJ5376960.1 hypothetical protein N7509_013846 [Penicillium cosmopolitanum]